LVAAAAGQPQVLVFSRTAAFRHQSIPAGLGGLTQLAQQYAFGLTATEDHAQFNEAFLASFAAVVFLSTSGDVLDDAEQAAFERYIAAGHGYVGVHAAADCEYDWPWYGGLVGAPRRTRLLHRARPHRRKLQRAGFYEPSARGHSVGRRQRPLVTTSGKTARHAREFAK